MKWMQFLTPARSMDFNETRRYIDGHTGDDMIVLDVRQPSEYRENHIPGAILIPLPQLPDRLEELDPEKAVLVY